MLTHAQKKKLDLKDGHHRCKSLATAFAAATSSNVGYAETLKRTRAEAATAESELRQEVSVVEADLKDMTNEAISATDAQQEAQVEAANSTRAAAQNISGAHREHLQTLSGETAFLRQLLADNPLLIVAAPRVEMRISQLSSLATSIRRTVAIEESWTQPVQPHTTASGSS